VQPRPRHFGHLHQSLTHARSANIASLSQSSVAEHPAISRNNRSDPLSTWIVLQMPLRKIRTDGVRITIYDSRRMVDSKVAGRTIALPTLMDLGVPEEIDTERQAIY
jgi:hypothetical protein